MHPRFDAGPGDAVVVALKRTGRMNEQIGLAQHRRERCAVAGIAGDGFRADAVRESGRPLGVARCEGDRDSGSFRQTGRDPAAEDARAAENYNPFHGLIAHDLRDAIWPLLCSDA
jgi:hypothetical protein